jgi:hypothetical protein
VLDVNGAARISISSHGIPLHVGRRRNSNEKADA